MPKKKLLHTSELPASRCREFVSDVREILHGEKLPPDEETMAQLHALLELYGIDGPEPKGWRPPEPMMGKVTVKPDHSKPAALQEEAKKEIINLVDQYVRLELPTRIEVRWKGDPDAWRRALAVAMGNRPPEPEGTFLEPKADLGSKKKRPRKKS